jgi:hypothetical protein
MREHWDELCRLFEILGCLVNNFDEDEIEMYFTIAKDKHNSKDVSSLVEILKKRKNALQGISNINSRLEHILGEYCRALKSDGIFPRYRRAHDMKPLSVYVFTNALWERNSDPRATIKNVIDHLTTLQYPPTQVRIQFISFGNHPEALRRLEYYSENPEFDMYASINNN